MNLFLREIKKNYKSFLVWTIALVGINAFILSAFESVAQQADNTELLLSQYPEAFITALNLDKLLMTDILHYFASRSYLFITIFGSVYAMILASSILSKEESERTIEFLISKPITRTSIVTAKLLCTLVYITLLNVVFSISNYGFMNIFKINDFDMNGFLLVSIGPLLIHLIFAVIGVALSVYITKPRAIMSLSIGIVFAGYFFSILASLQENLGFFKYLNPFSYFNTENLVVETSIPLIFLVLTAGIIVAAVTATYILYSRKDIHT